MLKTWTELPYPADGRGDRQLTFRVSGNMLHDLKIIDASKQGWETISQKGHLMASVGAALGKARRDGTIPVFDVKYSWQRRGTIVGRPAQPLDCFLEGTRLLVLDAAWELQRVGGGELRCSDCKKNTLEDRGFHPNAMSSKGLGEEPVTYLAQRQTRCTTCGAVEVDSLKVRPTESSIWASIIAGRGGHHPFPCKALIQPLHAQTQSRVSRTTSRSSEMEPPVLPSCTSLMTCMLHCSLSFTAEAAAS